MNKRPLQAVAKQALTEYKKESDYLTLRTLDQLHLIKRAVVSQIALEVPQAKQYQGLLDNAKDQMAFRQKKKNDANTLAKWTLELRKAASQTTWQHWFWVAIISAVITGVFSLFAKQITNDWPWWGYFIGGVVIFISIGIGLLIFYCCRCDQKPVKQRVRELQNQSQVNVTG